MKLVFNITRLLINKVLINSMLIVVSLSMVSISTAEIYKWKDENGRWHFGDKAPDKKVENVKVQSETTEEKKVAQSSNDDLLKQLKEKYQDDSLITKVTISVVAVETEAGGGSGFFVSDNGYLITNKHVIRPASTEQWKQSLADEEEKLKEHEEIKSSLDEDKEYLKTFEKKIKDYKKYIATERMNKSEKAEAKKELRNGQDKYEKEKSEYREKLKKYEDKKRAIEKKISDLKWSEIMTSSAKRFKVYLKDNTVINANLVKISDKYDLALLKVDAKKTPYLEISKNNNQLQGGKVYAVGSPLGMRDSVTSGVITRIDEEYLMTDAQILPGNSGGPLVSEDGAILGVNTMKLSQDSMSQGFGIAIPATRIIEEFSQYLKGI